MVMSYITEALKNYISPTALTEVYYTQFWCPELSSGYLNWVKVGDVAYVKLFKV